MLSNEIFRKLREYIFRKSPLTSPPSALLAVLALRLMHILNAFIRSRKTRRLYFLFLNLLSMFPQSLSSGMSYPSDLYPKAFFPPNLSCCLPKFFFQGRCLATYRTSALPFTSVDVKEHCIYYILYDWIEWGRVRPVFHNLFTMEEHVKYLSGFRESLLKLIDLQSMVQ